MLPPAPAAAVEEEQIPTSPFDQVQTQSLEDEMGKDAAVAEVPIEPAQAQDVSPPSAEAPAVDTTAQSPTEVSPTAVSPTEKPAAAATTATAAPAEPAETEKKCQNCGTAVKDGWFLCPTCKKPLM